MAEKKKPHFGWSLASLAVMGAALYGCLFTGSPRERSPEELRAEKMSKAYFRCENATKDSLADAEGVRIADHALWSSTWDEARDNVKFEFDLVARNAFGALVPGRVRCAATHDGTYWTVTDLAQI